jgi:hypothetical protein
LMCYIDGDPSLRWRVQRSQPLKTKKATLTGDPFWFLVEAAGETPIFSTVFKSITYSAVSAAYTLIM